MAGNRLLLYCLFLICNGILFENCVQGQITKLCQAPKDEKLAHERQLELKKIEERFTEAKLKAATLIAKLKQHHNQSKTEEFEKEYQDFIQDYDVFVYMMDADPANCDRLIKELHESIDYFIVHILPKYAN